MIRPALALLCLCFSLAAESILIRGASIHPVTSAEIAGASLLITDGVIADIGPKIQIPKGAKIVEAKGLHLYPGLINSATTMGLFEISSVRETDDSAELGDFNPQLRAVVAINPESEHIPVSRANGLTSAIVLPMGGIIAGQAALVHLDGWTWEEMALSRAAALHLRFPVLEMTAGEPPNRVARIPFKEAKTRYDERLQRLNAFVEQSRRYQTAKKASGAGFRADLLYEAMLPVLDNHMPVLVTVERERDIRAALDFAARQKIRIVLAGVREPGQQINRIRDMKIPVILSSTLALPIEEDAPYDSAFTLPVELFKAGIRFAFGTFTSYNARNLPYQAAAAVAFGLPAEEALKSVTINAAEIWGVAGKIGSIERGKLADLILTDGDPLETRTQIKQMFIRGLPVSLESKHTRLYEKYMNRP